MLERLKRTLASPRLALALLVLILACCLAGATIVRGERAWQYIFSTYWFNGILVLLVINVAVCFFGRIRFSGLTPVAFGMILFHLSFVGIFLGIVYNSLTYFRAEIRLTEGERLPNDREESYDKIYHGRLFSMKRLKGETVLHKVNVGFTENGQDKRVAYEVSVEDGPRRSHGYLYATRNLTHRGYTYYPNREGYSTLLILSDKNGREIYGAHLPLQSLPAGEMKFLYTNGTKEGPKAIPFPLAPEEPRFAVNVAYEPDKTKERSGVVRYRVYTLHPQGDEKSDSPIAEGSAPVGQPFSFGDYRLTVREIRYWAVMDVRYEPGKPIILTSLWTAFAGILITTLARIFRTRPVEARPPVGGEEVLADRS